MSLKFTILIRFILNRKLQGVLLALLLLFINIPSKAVAYPYRDSADNSKKNSVINDLDDCGIPASMVARIRHMSPVEIQALDEEFQETSLKEDGEEMVVTVKLRFIEDHIRGYVKQSPLNNSSEEQNVRYVDIPVEWMCIPPNPEHPFHFASSIAELKTMQEENGCLAWVQRDSDVHITFATNSKKKKSKSSH